MPTVHVGWTQLVNLSMAGEMYCIYVLWDQGVAYGVHFGVFDTIPIRARAYNDCVRIPILLKTRSNRGILDPA